MLDKNCICEKGLVNLSFRMYFTNIQQTWHWYSIKILRRSIFTMATNFTCHIQK